MAKGEKGEILATANKIIKKKMMRHINVVIK